MIYVREGILSGLIQPVSRKFDKEYLLVTTNVIKEQLLVCSYSPLEVIVNDFLEQVGKFGVGPSPKFIRKKQAKWI